MAAEPRVFELEGTITEKGEIVPLHFAMYRRLFQRCGLIGQTVLIKVQLLRQKRSDAQNRYIHGIVVPTVQAWKFENEGVRWSHDATYFWLRRALLEDDIIIEEVGGYQVPVITGKRFSKMTVDEFSYAVFDVIIPKLHAMGCDVRLPKKNNLLTDHLTDD